MKDLVSISKDNEIAELREKVAKLESRLASKEALVGLLLFVRGDKGGLSRNYNDLLGVDY